MILWGEISPRYNMKLYSFIENMAIPSYYMYYVLKKLFTLLIVKNFLLHLQMTFKLW